VKTLGAITLVILLIGSITRGAIVPRPMAQFLRDVVAVGLGGDESSETSEWTQPVPQYNPPAP